MGVGLIISTFLFLTGELSGAKLTVDKGIMNCFIIAKYTS